MLYNRNRSYKLRTLKDFLFTIGLKKNQSINIDTFANNYGPPSVIKNLASLESIFWKNQGPIVHKWHHYEGQKVKATANNLSSIHLYDSIAVLEKNKVARPQHSQVGKIK